MNIITALFNRTTAAADALGRWINGSIFPDATINPQDRIGDPLSSLTAAVIHFDYRRRVNKGEFTMPTWALWNAAQVLPIIGDKMAYWSSSLGGMDWDVRLSEVVKDRPELKGAAEAQADSLRAAYERQKVEEIVKHLALARFYGFSVLSRKTPLQPIDWWNVLRNGLHGAYYYNPEARVSSTSNLPDEMAMKAEDYIIRECMDNMLITCLRAYVRAQDIEDWWDKNLEAESRRQVVVLTARAPKGEGANYTQAAINIAAGRSGYIAKGEPGNETQVIFPPASRGLVYYGERLKQIDESLTKLLTGSQLTMLTAPGSGTLAGNAHEKTAQGVIAAEAGQVSEVLQEQFDKPALIRAKLLKPGETPLAYFTLRVSKAVDPDKEIAWTAQLAASGIQRDVVELGERVGMKLEQRPDPVPQAGAWGGGGGYMQNREPVKPVEPDKPNEDPPANRAASDSVAAALAVPAEWLAPVRDRINALAAKLPGMEPEAAAAEVQKLIDTLPELFDQMDVDALAGVMEKAMLEAVKEKGESIENRYLYHLQNNFDPDQPRDEKGRWAETGGLEADENDVKKSKENMDSLKSKYESFKKIHSEGYDDSFNPHAKDFDSAVSDYAAKKRAFDWTPQKTIEKRDKFNEAMRKATAQKKTANQALSEFRRENGYGVEDIKSALSKWRERGTLKNSVGFDPDQPRDGDGKWSETGSSRTQDEISILKKKTHEMALKSNPSSKSDVIDKIIEKGIGGIPDNTVLMSRPDGNKLTWKSGYIVNEKNGTELKRTKAESKEMEDQVVMMYAIKESAQGIKIGN